MMPDFQSDYARPYKRTDLDETKRNIKDGSGLIYSISATNVHATDARYLKIYDATNALTTVGTTTPVLSYLIPALGGISISVAKGILFLNGITIACVTGAADNSTDPPGASEVDVNIIWA
jgi:hypothetical protein